MDRAQKPSEQFLEPVGNTVREQKHRRGVHAVLVIGQSLTSHFWLNILPVACNPRIQHFVTQSDLEQIADRLHVRPTVVPSFLVMSDGFVVDWFPAPLPTPGHAANPQVLVDSVNERLRAYT